MRTMDIDRNNSKATLPHATVAEVIMLFVLNMLYAIIDSSNF